MDQYPSELLTGVFPLVFCVNATLPTGTASEDASGGSSGPASPRRRSPFDRFLDALAASVLDAPTAASPRTSAGNNSSMNASARSLFAALDVAKEYSHTSIPKEDGDDSDFSTDEEDDDDDDEVVWKAAGPAHPTVSGPTLGIGFPRLVPSSKRDAVAPTSKASAKKAFRFAKNQHQSFFQRARMVPIGIRHGFPPSQDPTGEEHLLEHVLIPGTTNLHKGQLLEQLCVHNPLDGLLSEGWLEKHAHAVPSVVVVVVTVGAGDTQEAQNQRLLETIENLQNCMAPKRNCQIHIVGLILEEGNQSSDTWKTNVSGQIFDQTGSTPAIHLLDVQEDLSTDQIQASSNLLSVCDVLQTASLEYYQGQGKHGKRKLKRLGPTKSTPVVLPLTIRYAFKVATFYEFQWKHMQSLRYYSKAYSYLCNYYTYLLEQENEPQRNVSANSFLDTPKDQNPGSTDSEIEVALPDASASFPVPKPPADMKDQCRAVADWISLKLVHAGLTSTTSQGRAFAQQQWERHAQTFCQLKNDWKDWQYISHQRLVASQLWERYDAPSSRMARCAPWRLYQATTESLLQLRLAVESAQGSEIQKRLTSQASATSSSTTNTRYLGACDAEVDARTLQELNKQGHLQEQALEYALKAIELLEKQEKGEPAVDFTRAVRIGARLYYLTGGLLCSLDRHEKAIPYLERAVRLCQGWSGLELLVRKLLMECYEKVPRSILPNETDQTQQEIASMILDSYFNSQMSNTKLRVALERFAAATGTLKWHRECIDEANDSSLPFLFALTFPDRTHATAGDAVEASLWIKSNLDYAVHVNSVCLQSFLGPLLIPSSDLLSAKNASEGHDGGIIIQAKTEIMLSTIITLPRDLSKIAVDESGNGGEKQGTAGKGSFAKSARPRTGGITAAAGARFVSEDIFGSASSRPRNAQWSVVSLGGKPLRADGLKMVFHPVYIEAASQAGSTDKACDIELTIEKKLPETAVNIKRTPFEADNYIASAWSRPKDLPLLRGPRCLRVLPPMASMIATNVTELQTRGNVLEGTVNRILIKLQAGPTENCSDIQIQVRSSNLLILPGGKSCKIVNEEYLDAQENAEPASNPLVRTPVLVQKEESASGVQTGFGYDLPSGWALAGDGFGNGRDPVKVVSSLAAGGYTYAYFDVYRPGPVVMSATNGLDVGEPREGAEFDSSTCQTDFDVSVSYKQERTDVAKRKTQGRRRGRASAVSADAALAATRGSPESLADVVTLEFSGSVYWAPAIAASFQDGFKMSPPSGNRHPSNGITADFDTSTEKAQEMVLIDGETATSRCTIEATSAIEGLAMEVSQVEFHDDDVENTPCSFALKSCRNDSNVLYSNPNDGAGYKLANGSKLVVSYATTVKMKADYLKGSVSATLGRVSVYWKPEPLDIPIELKGVDGDVVDCHGPLALKEASKCTFVGQACYIENAPFDAQVAKVPRSPRVALPFDISYTIVNKTSLDQKVSVFLEDTYGDEDPSVVVTGCLTGEIHLGPHESYLLSVQALATRVGSVTLPEISVSSDRYQTWIVKSRSARDRTLFVLP